MTMPPWRTNFPKDILQRAFYSFQDVSDHKIPKYESVTEIEAPSINHLSILTPSYWKQLKFPAAIGRNKMCACKHHYGRTDGNSEQKCCPLVRGRWGHWVTDQSLWERWSSGTMSLPSCIHELQCQGRLTHHLEYWMQYSMLSSSHKGLSPSKFSIPCDFFLKRSMRRPLRLTWFITIISLSQKSLTWSYMQRSL